jgi:hypothetical protein
MSRIYATREDSGKKVLVELVCDRCGDKIKPNQNIQESGWTKHGYMDGGGNIFESERCEGCS